MDAQTLSPVVDAVVLRERGWIELEAFRTEEGMRRFGESLSHLGVTSLERVLPRSKGSGRGHSFSHKHGLDRFPLHTDTTFWSEPARYILMQSDAGSSTPTLLFGKDQVAELLAQPCAARAIFRSQRILGPVYSGVTGDSGGMPPWSIRFDPMHMTAANDAAKAFLKLVEAGSDRTHQFCYTGTNSLLVDNWACLHGRGRVAAADVGRVLLRTYIGGRK
ncbi:hypothetical protein QE424_002751 [Stenotrophomonas rhizophila]|uniref:TauD/TfdA-like domain-containing protein n=1 Tax=Stenotrophomonas rhizophila TaxID=216778 RepID=A0AAP5EAS5_9GAMM|nr:hypothetical protein [Stenotrophomonas rhizophila]